MKNNTTVQTKSNQQTIANQKTEVKTEVSKGMVISFSALGGLIGVWSVACLIGGLVASGGPLSFVKTYFSAVTGI